MDINLSENKIIIFYPEHFCARDIFECGQVFRYTKTADGYNIISGDKCAEVKECENFTEINTDDVMYFYKYFDLDTDYSSIIKLLSIYEIMQKPLEYGKGIRILKQDFTETLFSFIISANNNIKRIQLIIRRLCDSLGKDCGSYRAFPTVDAMASQSESFYKEIGMGYRAPYFLHTAKTLSNGNFDIINQDTETARKSLLKLYGVGNKVADCILLFGMNRQDVFPVDVWIERVYIDYFAVSAGAARDRLDMSKRLVKLFGDYSGYAQQYLFYYKRELEK